MYNGECEINTNDVIIGRRRRPVGAQGAENYCMLTPVKVLRARARIVNSKFI